MAKEKNKQLGNAGNAGDIAKHATWVALLTALDARVPNGQRLLVVETHAFQPSAPLAKSSPIGADGRVLTLPRVLETLFAGRAPAPGAAAQLAPYLRLEGTAVSGFYTCSPGLSRGLLGARADYLLAEKDADCRRELLAAGFQRGEICADSTELPGRLQERGLAPGGLALLFDPFSWKRDASLWRVVAESL